MAAANVGHREIESTAMRIKKITATCDYKHVEFGLLKDDWRGRFVFSPMGFQPVLRFEYIKTGPSRRLDLSNGEQILCDPGHIVATTSGPKFVKDLYCDDKLIGYNNQEITFIDSDGPVVDLYDIEIPNPHWYYTAGIISHNTLIMINSAYAGMKAGHNVLFVTFELSTYKSALRMASLMSTVPTKKFVSSNVDELSQEKLHALRDQQTMVRESIKIRKGKCGDLAIYELPPDECSVDEIYGIIEHNRKTRGWVPKIVVLDYLELMQSRHTYNNSNGDYTRQKSVATEIRGLAKNENVFVYTATQTNRGGVKSENGKEGKGNADQAGHINLDKAAESFGKAMPVDYVISLNQTEDEYNRDIDKDGNSEPSVIRLWIAKNRNGRKFIPVTTNVFYDQMLITEILTH